MEGKDGAGEWTRKYFIIDGGSLTFHASHSSTLVVQGGFKLPPTTQVGRIRALKLSSKLSSPAAAGRGVEAGGLTHIAARLWRCCKERTRLVIPCRCKEPQETVKEGEEGGYSHWYTPLALL